MVDYLGKKLAKSLLKIEAKSKIDEDTINSVLREIKLSFLESDVNYKVTRDFIKNVKAKIEQEEIIKKLKPSHQVISIIHSELIKILGNSTKTIEQKTKILNILMIGLQGSGKTTTCVKIANYLKHHQNKKVLLIACDTYRSAAIDQLVKFAKTVNIDVYSEKDSNPLDIAKNALKHSKKHDYDINIFDTAGRTTVNEKLMDELVNLKQITKPDEIIFIIDALTGQDTYNVYQAFDNKIKITGTILTKFDSETRSGSAFTISYLAKSPIYFVGTGEKISDISKFHPDRLADRIMGKGDIITLVEKTKAAIDPKSAKKAISRILSGKFDLEDLIQQLEQVNKMGSLKGIFKLLPKSKMMPKISDTQIKAAENKIRTIKILASSMTLKERRNISLLQNQSRKKRIIKGSGLTSKDYDTMVKQIKVAREQTKKLRNVMKFADQGKMPFM